MTERKPRTARGKVNGTQTAPEGRPRARRRSTIGVNPLDAVGAEQASSAAPDVKAPRPTTAPEQPKQTPPSTDASQRMFRTWAEGTEKTLKAILDTQTAALRAGISVLEANTNARRDLEREWTAAAREAQAAALSAFRASLEATTQMSTPWKPSSTSRESRKP